MQDRETIVRFIRSIVIALFCSAVMLLGAYFAYGWIILNGVKTIYSSHFSQQGFDQFPMHSTTMDAKAQLGPPLKIMNFEDGNEYWFYSRADPGGSGSYEKKILVFDSSRNLVKKIDDLFLD